MGTTDVSYIRKTAEQIQTLQTKLKRIRDDLSVEENGMDRFYDFLAEQIDAQTGRMGAMYIVLLEAANLYEECEHHIADVFDLESLPSVQTRFGISHFEQLEMHEKLMPIHKEST